MKVLIINGPNLNMLGIREPDVYGKETYDELMRKVELHCQIKGIFHEIYQSNHEGDLVDKIQEAYGRVDGIVINPAAYTHTSVAILDALLAVNIVVTSFLSLSLLHLYYSTSLAICQGFFKKFFKNFLNRLSLFFPLSIIIIALFWEFVKLPSCTKFHIHFCK